MGKVQENQENDKMCMYEIFVALFADSAMTKYKNNETAKELYGQLKDLVSGVIRRNAYSEVNLDKLFQSTFQLKARNHQLTGWYWVDTLLLYKPNEQVIYQMKCFHEQVNSWFDINVLWRCNIYQFHWCSDKLPISQTLCNFYTLNGYDLTDIFINIVHV